MKAGLTVVNASRTLSPTHPSRPSTASPLTLIPTPTRMTPPSALDGQTTAVCASAAGLSARTSGGGREGTSRRNVVLSRRATGGGEPADGGGDDEGCWTRTVLSASGWVGGVVGMRDDGRDE